MNTIPAEFDEIRPYMPHELPAVYEELIADPEFKAVMGYAFKDIPFENIAAMMRGASTNIEFQKAIVYPFVKGLLVTVTVSETTPSTRTSNEPAPVRVKIG